MRHRLVAITAGLSLAIGIVTPVLAAAPVVTSDMRAINEGGSTTIDVLANDWDPDGDTLTIASFTQPVGGTVVRAAAAGSLRITPFTDFSGYLLFDYTASDGTGATATTQVLVFVDPVDDAPVAQDTSAVTAFRSGVRVGLDGSDWETCELTFAIVSGPHHGTLSGLTDADCVSGGPADPGPLATSTDSASIVYTPRPGFSGADTFTFTVSDGTTTSEPATVSISVAKQKSKGLHSGIGGSGIRVAGAPATTLTRGVRLTVARLD